MFKGKKLKALEMLVAGEHKSYEKIAEELEISAKTLYNWRCEGEFSKELARRINIKIGGIAPRALKKIEKLIETKDEDVALKAAKDILDRAGYKAREKMDVSSEAKVSGVVSVSFEGELEEWSE